MAIRGEENCEVPLIEKTLAMVVVLLQVKNLSSEKIEVVDMVAETLEIRSVKPGVDLVDVDFDDFIDDKVEEIQQVIVH